MPLVNCIVSAFCLFFIPVHSPNMKRQKWSTSVTSITAFENECSLCVLLKPSICSPNGASREKSVQLVAKQKAWHSGDKAFVMRTWTRSRVSYDHESTGQSHRYEIIIFGFGDNMMTSFALSPADLSLDSSECFSVDYHPFSLWSAAASAESCCAS